MSALALENIPEEIYFMVTELLSSSDLNNLCKVSKVFHARTVKHLYKSISLSTSEDCIEEIDGSQFCAAGDKGHLAYTQHIKIWASFHAKTSSRCMHMDRAYHDPCWEESENVIEGMVEELKRDVLDHCEAGAIRSLDWSLGTCVPLSLLGPTGYFTSTQQKLESIRLVTDGSCMWKRDDDRDRLAIGEFPCVKRLSWTGLSTLDDFETLGDTLEKRSHQLEELEIDLTYHRDLPSDYESDDEDEHSDFAVRILKLHKPTLGRFPVLKRLALAAVPLTAGKSGEVAQRVLKRICDVFDFSSLQSLKLQRCQGWEDLIMLLNRRMEPLKLKSLEVQWGFNNGPTDSEEAILPLLQRIQGLEELFLYTAGLLDPTDLWRALLHQRTTLRRFVHHQRSIYLGDQDDESEAFELECDSTDLDLNDPELLTDGRDSLGKFDLISLGLCCTPSHMRRLVSDFASKTSLQVLHMRQSGTDLKHFSCWSRAAGRDDPPFDFTGMNVPNRYPSGLGSSFVDFAQWAFGPAGIRSLRLLAYGDFSYGGRFAATTLLLCRRELPRSTQSSDTEDAHKFLRFREVEEGKDRELWELYEREMHVLKACPTDSLFHVDT